MTKKSIKKNFNYSKKRAIKEWEETSKHKIFYGITPFKSIITFINCSNVTPKISEEKTGYKNIITFKVD